MRFAHANIVTRDWVRLSRFYERALNLRRVPPERDLSGDWLQRATGVPGAHIRGVHLSLPGASDREPTLEIFQYDEVLSATKSVPNREGIGHIAFEVEDVEATVRQVIAEGGHSIGETVSQEIAGAGRIVFAYVADPDGNILELQHWTA